MTIVGETPLLIKYDMHVEITERSYLMKWNNLLPVIKGTNLNFTFAKKASADF